MAATARYDVKSGDWLAKIAQDHGTTVGAIWNHPDNAAHRTKRGSPDVLYPGDVLFIPMAPLPQVPPVAPPPSVPLPELPLTPPVPPDVPAKAWPYPPPPPSDTPTWTCPGGTCQCSHEEPPLPVVTHTIFLHDSQSRRMPHAAVRVYRAGRVVPGVYQADASGAVVFEVHERTEDLVVAWAPHDTPIDASLPYRRRYRPAEGLTGRDGVRTRLDHIGVIEDPSLEERVRAFQEEYALYIDGNPASLEATLAAYHDLGQLPPLPSRDDGAPTPLPPDRRSRRQGALSGVRLLGCHVSLQLMAHDGTPMAHCPFVLDVGAGRTHIDQTDGDGQLEYGEVTAGDYALQMGSQLMFVPAIPKTERYRMLLFVGEG